MIEYYLRHKSIMEMTEDEFCNLCSVLADSYYDKTGSTLSDDLSEEEEEENASQYR